MAALTMFGAGCIDTDWTPPSLSNLDGSSRADGQVGGDHPDDGTPGVDAGDLDWGQMPVRDMLGPLADARVRDVDPPRPDQEVRPQVPAGHTLCDGPNDDEPPCNGCPRDTIVPPSFSCIPAGTFMMGSPGNEVGRIERHPIRGTEHERRHEVRITRPFFMQQTEVSQAEWKRYTGTGDDRKPSYFYSSDLLPAPLPVESINWYEALRLANGRSRHEGLETCYALGGCGAGLGAGCPDGEIYCENNTYTCDTVEWVGGFDCMGYRLPTEAEWEYAARADTDGAYWWGSSRVPVGVSEDVGNNQARCWGTDPVPDAPCPSDRNMSGRAVYCCNSRQIAALRLGHTATIGARTPNPWGLIDILGNVEEWAWDRYDDDYGGLNNVVDPTGPGGMGGPRIVRGGSFYHSPPDLRAAFRWSEPKHRRDVTNGVRLVRTVPR